MALPLLTLPALLTVVETYVLDRGERLTPAAQEEYGLSDADLWTRLRTGGDCLAGMTFDEAVARDPRRIEALIDQRILNDVLAALAYLDASITETMLRDLYLARNVALREIYGTVPTEGILATRRQSWEHYAKVLEVSRKMARAGTPAEAFWRGVITGWVTIAQAHREALAIAERAQASAATHDDAAGTQAWAEVTAMVRDQFLVLQDAAFQMGLPAAPATVPAPDAFGALPDWAASRYLSGHRAPGSDPDAWARQGGRL